MKLTSSAFKEGEKIPRVYSCQGKDVNPPLEISGVPAAAKSLVLIMVDYDVPEWVRKEKVYDHWLIYNLDPGTKEIEEATAQVGIYGKNTGGKNAYAGPCPPDGEHRYFFKLYALNCLLDLKEGATKKELQHAMEGHILEECALMGTYEKA